MKKVSLFPVIISVCDTFSFVFYLSHIKMSLLSRFLNLSILSIVVKSGISISNDLTILSIWLSGVIIKQVPFLSEQALKLFNACFIL